MHRWISRLCLLFALVFVFAPMYACAHADPARLSAVPSSCARPPLPLTVAATPEAAYMLGAVLGAGDEWAEAMGVPAVFSRAPAGATQVDLLVTTGAPPRGRRWAASTRSVCIGSWYHHVLTYHRGLDALESRYYTLHEVGHVLGLRDSTNLTSIMNPSTADDLMGSWGTFSPDDDAWGSMQTVGYVMQQSDILTLKSVYRD